MLASVDRFTWGIVAGTTLLVVAAIAAVLLVRQDATPPDLSTPDGTVRAYLEAIDSGQPERAWELLGERQQTEISRDQFITRATTAHRSPREGRITIDQSVVEGSTSRVELSQTFASGGPPIFGPSSYTNRMTARLELQRGQWRITVPPENYWFLYDRPSAPPIVITATPPTPTQTASPGPAVTATR
jgi:hypothetical protein